jgi:hypothetical protein
VVVDDAQLFNTKLQEWEDFYNFDRPHGGLGGQTPYERLRDKTRTPAVRGDRQLHMERETGFEPATRSDSGWGWPSRAGVRHGRHHHWESG